MLTPGPRNLITDVPGIKVGNAEDHDVKSGVTVLTADAPFRASVHVMGGAPGTRETDLLAPQNLVERVDALVLSGGSAFGLEAGSGVANALRNMGRGFMAHGQNVPIVPSAILFDLANGGDKDWETPPYAELGATAFAAASPEFEIGTTGAGTGALTANLKGGLGSASMVLENGTVVGAIAAVNAMGEVTQGDSPHFWASPFEIDSEFGGKGNSPTAPATKARLKKIALNSATTVAIVATNADLNKSQLHRMAMVAHDGLARAIVPSHTPLDGDLIFAASTGEVGVTDTVAETTFIGHAASICLSRAIARGVFHARAMPGDLTPTWTDRFGS